MNNLIRSELLKQRTIRPPLIAVAAVAIAGAMTAIALITTAGHAGNPPHDGHSLSELVHAPFAVVAGVALLLGILGTAGEFRHQDDHQHPAGRTPARPASPHRSSSMRDSERRSRSWGAQ
jgi:hypothetical protein